MDALDLIAKIKMDLSEYEEGLDKAKSSAEKEGGGIGAALGKAASVGGKALVGLTKVTAAAVGAAATGVGALVKSSVDAYANYEQMVGGVKKLYGNMGMTLEKYAESQHTTVDKVKEKYNELEKAQNQVIQNAQNAYKTSGMSANQYMETATSFSAKLIKDLKGNTVEAARVTDVAMQAISDNYNTFGGDIGMIQGAFQGFAKGNYMMLDNLKLGYGGTKTEMEKLIADANEYAKTIGKAGDLTIDSFADQIEAIELIQEKQQIAGTTAREATTTIEGSLGMLRAAWENLVTGIADKDADLSQLMKNVVDAIVGTTDESGKHINGFIDNILPVITNALESIGTLVQELVPKALEMLPSLIESVLPDLVSAATSLVQGLVDAFSSNMDTISQVINQLITSIVGLLPDLVSLGGQVASTLGSAIIDNLDSILEAGSQILEILLTGMSEHAGDIVSAAVQIIEMLAGFFTENIDLVVQSAILIVMGIAQGLMDNLDVLLTAAITIITSLGEALISNLPLIIDQIPLLVDSLITSLVEFLPQMTEAWISLMDCLPEALPEIIDSVLNALPMLMDTLVNYWLGDGFQQTFRAAVIMFGALTKALGMAALQIVANIGMFVRRIGSQIAGEAKTLLEAGKTFFGGLLTGITGKISEIIGKVKEFVSNIGTTIHSGITTIINGAKNWGSDMIRNFVSGITSKWADLKGTVTNVANIIKSLLHFSEPDIGPLSDFHTYAPDMMDLFMKGINDNKKKLGDTVESAFDFKDSIQPPQLTATTQIKGGQQTTESDIDQLLEKMNITINTYTELDSQVINKKTYKYTLGQLGADTRAMKVAMGGRV